MVSSGRRKKESIISTEEFEDGFGIGFEIEFEALKIAFEINRFSESFFYFLEKRIVLQRNFEERDGKKKKNVEEKVEIG